MKHLSSAAAAILICVPAIVMAGDKPTPQRDLQGGTTIPARPTITSTANEPTKPVELIRPQDAMDSAIRNPAKYQPAAELETALQQPIDPAQAAAEEAAQRAASPEPRRKPVAETKKSAKKYKKTSKKRHVRKKPSGTVKRQ